MLDNTHSLIRTSPDEEFIGVCMYCGKEGLPMGAERELCTEAPDYVGEKPKKHLLGEDIKKDAWVYARAAHEYYHGSGQSNLTDAEYDALTEILCINWHLIPKKLQKLFGSPGEIRTTGMHIKL